MKPSLSLRCSTKNQWQSVAISTDNQTTSSCNAWYILDHILSLATCFQPVLARAHALREQRGHGACSLRFTLSDTLVGHSCGKLFEGLSCGPLLWENFVGHSCGFLPLAFLLPAFFLEPVFLQLKAGSYLAAWMERFPRMRHDGDRLFIFHLAFLCLTPVPPNDTHSNANDIHLYHN